LLLGGAKKKIKEGGECLEKDRKLVSDGKRQRLAREDRLTGRSAVRKEAAGEIRRSPAGTGDLGKENWLQAGEPASAVRERKDVIAKEEG